MILPPKDMQTDDPRSAQRTRLRQVTLQLVLAVTALDAVAIALFYLSGIERAAPRAQMVFTAGWVLATVLVVVVMLRRVRKARFANQRASSG